MSKGAFAPSGKATFEDLPENVDPDVKVKKLSSDEMKTAGGKEVGGPRGPSYNFTGVAPGKTYVHPPSRLINGRVMYPCKYVGHLMVPEARGKDIVHDAIDKLLTVAAVNKTNLDEEMPEVNLSISIRSLATIDKQTNKAILQHPLHLISFSADDKRKKGNMFAYICRGKPPVKEHICYVYQCSATQAKEITATVGQAFELAYKKFLQTKKAQEDYKRLKEMLKTASPEERVEIERQLVEVNKIRAAEYERQKKIAAMQAKMPDSALTKKKEERELALAKKKEEEEWKEIESQADPELQAASKVKEVQKEISQLEIASERQLQQAKLDAARQKPSVESKWENVAMVEGSEVDPSMDPGTQHLVKRLETKELDSAIYDIEDEIRVLEEAFDWHRRKGQGPVPSLYDDVEEETSEDTSEADALKLLEKIDGDVSKAKATADFLDLEIPELPANYVMDEFMKAKEKAAMPKPGTVKDAAGAWYKEHHD